jgi:hypothetical protein
MNLETIPDLTLVFSQEDVPLCAICDNPIWEYESASLFRAHHAVGLGHYDCVSDLESEAELKGESE